MSEERAASQGEHQPSLHHLQKEVDKNHRDLGALRDKQAGHEKQLIEHDFQLRQHADSLNRGNAKFSDVENRIAPKWGYIIAVVMATGGMIWSLSKYPDADRFEALQNRVNSLQTDQNNSRRDVEDLRKDIKRLEESVNTINVKLDKLLLRP